MRRKMLKCTALAAAALLVCAPGAGAKKPKKVERVATAAYDATQQVGANTPVVYLGYLHQQIVAASEPGERYVSVALKDATGQNVVFFLTHSPQPADPGSSTAYCGSTPDPIAIPPGGAVYVWIWQGTCDDGTPAVATTGTVEATFSNKV